MLVQSSWHWKDGKWRRDGLVVIIRVGGEYTKAGLVYPGYCAPLESVHGELALYMYLREPACIHDSYCWHRVSVVSFEFVSFRRSVDGVVCTVG